MPKLAKYWVWMAGNKNAGAGEGEVLQSELPGIYSFFRAQ